VTIKPKNLPALLADAQAILFDFDGPLCDVFAGFPASTVARRLEGILGESFDTADPLEVLRQSVRFGRNATLAVELELIAAELEAIETSTPTHGGLKAVESCLAAKKSVGIVSNNSKQAVLRFLERERNATVLYPIVGRVYGEPALMKPNPYPMHLALKNLGISPEKTVFIGDSLSDIEVGHITGTSIIAYANSSAKKVIFEQEGEPIISSMLEIVAAMQGG
jgi:HAD superfamily hydrolase (TIGR01549 family)